MPPPCAFFARGGCKRGARCYYAHESPFNNNQFLQGLELRAEAAPFHPGVTVAADISDISHDSHTATKLKCHFYLQGTCKNGYFCRFSHNGEDQEPALPVIANTTERSLVSRDIKIDEVTAQLSETLELNQESRVFRGANVSFKDGAEVSSIHLTTSSFISTERYQLGTVSCSWYKPSKGAWLHYNNRTDAQMAIKTFGGTHKVNGRVLQAKMGPAPHHRIQEPIWSVVLGNLNVNTSEEDLRSTLRGVAPDKIKFGKYSHSMSETEACSLVEGRLRECGPLESFEMSHSLNASRMKALARFTNAADAQAAASQLSGKNLTIAGEYGSIKLFVNLTASVKFLVLSALYEVSRQDIKKVQSVSDSVRVNAYPPDREGKPVVIRIIGQDLQAVSKAKAVFEKLIKGDVIVNDDGSTSWDDYFVSAAGLAYVKALSQPGQTFVYRDARKRQLIVHGSSQAFEGTRQAILMKLKELSDMIQVLSLTPDLLSRALKGAFRHMFETLGRDVVKLDITTTPPSIVVRGNAALFSRAYSLLLLPLHEYSLLDQKSSSDDECPVCMMKPEDPVSLRCGHSYCKDCFESQCSVTDNPKIPLYCFGEYAKCGRTILLQDLKDKLPPATFESLLNASFDTYLQRHPSKYQYCPSPDCPMVYAVTKDGTTSSCSACLTTICTTCQTVSHDGITCKDSQYLVSDDYKALKA